MDKGVSGVQNVALLREAESEGMTVCGAICSAFPAKRTKTTPRSSSRCRHSSICNHPRVRCGSWSSAFRRISTGPSSASPRSSRHRSIKLPTASRRPNWKTWSFCSRPSRRGSLPRSRSGSRRTIHAWRGAHQHRPLYRYDEPGATVVVDRRVGWPRTEHRIADPAERCLFALLDTPQTLESLRARLADDSIVTEPALGRGRARTPRTAGTRLSRWRQVRRLAEPPRRCEHQIVERAGHLHGPEVPA